MSHYHSRYNDSPDAWPLTSSCGGGCGGSAPRIGASPMLQRSDESWQPDYVPRATVAPRTAMPRYFPDEQPDAVMPRHGTQRPVPSRSYDDYPDSPHFYTPRSLTTMGNYPRTFHCPDSLAGHRSHLYRHQSYPQELSMCPPGYYVESIDIKMPSWDGSTCLTNLSFSWMIPSLRSRMLEGLRWSGQAGP